MKETVATLKAEISDTQTKLQGKLAQLRAETEKTAIMKQ